MVLAYPRKKSLESCTINPRLMIPAHSVQAVFGSTKLRGTIESEIQFVQGRGLRTLGTSSFFFFSIFSAWHELIASAYLGELRPTKACSAIDHDY